MQFCFLLYLEKLFQSYPSVPAQQYSLCLLILISLKGEHMVLLLPYGVLYSVPDYPEMLAVFVVLEYFTDLVLG